MDVHWQLCNITINISNKHFSVYLISYVKKRKLNGNKSCTRRQGTIKLKYWVFFKESIQLKITFGNGKWGNILLTISHLKIHLL